MRPGVPRCCLGGPDDTWAVPRFPSSLISDMTSYCKRAEQLQFWPRVSHAGVVTAAREEDTGVSPGQRKAKPCLYKDGWVLVHPPPLPLAAKPPYQSFACTILLFCQNTRARKKTFIASKESWDHVRAPHRGPCAQPLQQPAPVPKGTAKAAENQLLAPKWLVQLAPASLQPRWRVAAWCHGPGWC